MIYNAIINCHVVDLLAILSQHSTTPIPRLATSSFHMPPSPVFRVSVMCYAMWHDFQKTFVKIVCPENESTHALMCLEYNHYL